MNQRAHQRLPLATPSESGGARAPSARGARGGGTALMQVGDLARETGKTVRAIHLYEELGLLRPAARSKGRFRLYDPDALVRIRWIGKLQEMNFSLTDIQTVVRESEEANSAPSAMVRMREVYKKKLEETRVHLRRLETLEHEMVATIEYLDTCDTCEPHRLLAACEACDHHECDTKVPDLVAGFRSQVRLTDNSTNNETLATKVAIREAR